jgi:hypothetical protein
MLRGMRLLVFGLTAIGFSQAQADWRFAHPNADVRISVNLQAVMKSPPIVELVKKAQSGPKDQAAQMQFALGLLSSVDRISISARQIGAATPAKKAQAAGDTDVLAFVTGSFDPAFIQSFFPSTGTSRVKQIGPHSILIGEGASFDQAVLRMAGSPSAGPSDELEQSDIWFSGNAAVMSQPSTSQAMPPAFKAMRAFSFGMNLGDSTELSMILTANDAAGASQMLKAVRESLGPLTQAPQAAAMLEQALQIKQDGARLRLHFVAPPELMRMAQAQAASGSFAQQLQPLMGMMGLPGGSATASSAAAQGPKGTVRTPIVADPPSNGKIMIYGLDDGPHEVKSK